jgi:hypothetical protein
MPDPFEVMTVQPYEVVSLSVRSVRTELESLGCVCGIPPGASGGCELQRARSLAADILIRYVASLCCPELHPIAACPAVASAPTRLSAVTSGCSSQGPAEAL